MQEEKFSIFIPIEIEKSTKKGEERYSDMRFKGIASNPNLGDDKQGQWLDPSGFDLNQFLSEGTINYHHLWKDKPTAIIGEPTAAKITKSNELYIEGKLYKGSQMARDVYDMAEIMEKNSDTRRMGFSIEGIPTLKDPLNKDRILKAKITNVAITPSPVCPGTKMEIIKGGLDGLEFLNQEGSEFIVDIESNGIRYIIDKDLNIHKADAGVPYGGKEGSPSTAAGADRVTTKEDVDKAKKRKKKLIDEPMSKSEIVTMLVQDYNLDLDSCRAFIGLAIEIEKSLIK